MTTGHKIANEDSENNPQAQSATVADILCKYAMDNPALPKGTQQRIAKQAADLLKQTNNQTSCN